MKSFVRLLLLMAIGALCVVQASYAHRFYAAFTQIDLRDAKKTIEITHRLFTHDVEDFLQLKIGNTSGLPEEEIEPYLKKFVEENFALFDKDGTRLPLTWIGMDYETDSVHIFQEATLPDDPSELFLINRIFMDLFDDQKNTVNIEWNDKIRTRIFRKDDEQKKVNFKEAD